MTINRDALFGKSPAAVHPHRGRIYGKNEDHRRLCVSVKVKGFPIMYLGAVMLKDVTFVVHRSGWLRMVRDQGVRNVHAWAVGTVWAYALDQNVTVDSSYRQAFYNYRAGHFADTVLADVPLTKASRVVQVGATCWYKP